MAPHVLNGSRLITDEQKETAWKLYHENNTISQIAEIVGISYTSTYIITAGRSRGFKSRRGYFEHLARKKGFNSTEEYTEHLMHQHGFNKSKDYLEDLAKRNGFDSYHDYLEDLAKRNGFDSHREHEDYLIHKRGFKNLEDYKKHLARKKGFRNISEYCNSLAKERSKRPENKALAKLIKYGLKDLDKTETWLAKQLEVRRQTVSLYGLGKIMPNSERLRLILSMLNKDGKIKGLESLTS